MTEPVLRWTVPQPLLMAEVAKRCLAASIDGGPAIFASDARKSKLRIDVMGSDEGDVWLEIQCDGEVAVLALAPKRPGGHRWRDSWMLVLERGADVATLTIPGDTALIANARREKIVGRLRQQHRAVPDPLGAPVPLVDAAFHRYTRQSSMIDETSIVSDVPLWALPTLPERAPWWELDLGRTMTIAWARIDLVRPPPGTRVQVHAFGYQTPAGLPPRDSLVLDAPVTSLGTSEDGIHAWIELHEVAVARFLRVTLVAVDAFVAIAVTGSEVQAAELYTDTLRESLRRAFVLHAERPLVLVRDRERGGYVPSLRYADVAARARALASGLARRLEGPGAPRPTIGVLLRNCAEWIVAELAILDRGYISVALSPDDADDRLAIVLAKSRPTCVLCEPDDVARVRRLAPDALVVACPLGGAATTVDDAVMWDTILEEGRAAPPPPLAPRSGDDIYAVLFTSGSTGTPKGAMRTYDTFLAMIASYAIGHSPRHLSFQPLSHLSERMYLPALLAHGGCMGFSEGGAQLFDELRALEPSTLGSVPRLYDVLYAKYQRRVREDPAQEAAALAEARAAFGTRLQAISVGSAPVSPEVYAFMKRCYADLWVSEGYGSTEVGSIAYDGKIADHVQVKLVPPPGTVPEPGAPERGEIWVRTPHAIAGYLGDPEATAAAIDAEGYFATGDLGERDGEGRVRVIGRLRNTVKLAQGEFVSAERIEGVLATAPGVDRIFVHVESGAAGVAALVTAKPDTAIDDRGMLAALAAHGRANGLASYEIPRGVLLAPITVENGLVTNNGKLARGAIAARHGRALAALVAGEVTAPALATGGDELLQRIVRVASSVLRRSIGATEPLGAGVDSLAAAEILAALSDELDREVPLAWWFEARTLADLARRLGTQASDASAIARIAAADLALATRVEPRAAQLPPGSPILLTGATGFLGAHLVEAFHERGIPVVCLVRAPDRASATARLAEALAARRIPPAIGDRVRAIPGDLAAPELGLAPAVRAEFDAIGAIVHAGATVSWLAPYDALRAPNVLGTLALLELAAGRPFHHVSTISTTYPGGDETTALPFEHAIAAGPYGLSKWIAEQHVQRAGSSAGVPVAIYRPAMIAGHTQRGVGNTDDFLCRYVAGCAELGRYVDRDDAIIDMTPVDFVARAIAALVIERPADGTTYHLANVDQSLGFGALGRAMVAAGVALAPATYDDFRAALLARPGSRLSALAAFFPPTFSLGMGPWPCARTLAALAPLGVVRPAIDDAIIARYVSAQLAPDPPPTTKS